MNRSTRSAARAVSMAVRPRPATVRRRTAQADASAAAEAAERAAEERVHAAILEAVMSHQLPPGTRLVEIPLSEAFGVTRTLLRRVLVRLANEKVVTLHHNRGAQVAEASLQETQDVFAVRRLLETALLRELPAPERRAIEALRALVDEEERAHDERRWSRLIRLSGEFHLRLAAASGNAELEELLRGLVARTSLMIALYESPDRGACAFHEHRVILAALARGDRAGAARHMAQHLHNCELQLRARPPAAPIDLVRLFGGATARRGRAARTTRSRRPT